MALIDRIDPTQENSISAHEFSAIIHHHLEATAPVDTLQKLGDKMGWDASDLPQLTQLKNFYNGLDQTGQNKFKSTLEGAIILWKLGRFSKAEFIASLGLSE